MFVPDRLKTNAFRVLRLSADATVSEIHKAAGSMRRAVSLGVATTTEADMPLLGEISRTEAEIRAAIGQLENPTQRLSERLFWFHLPPKSRDAKPPAHPSEPDGVAWGHDEALRGLFAAVEVGFDDVGVPVWVRALRAWHQVVSNDDYWAHIVEFEQRGAFEPAAFPSEIDALRGNAVELAAEPLVMAARDALASSDTTTVRRILTSLEELADTGPWAAISQHDIASPAVERFRAMCRAVREELGSKILQERDAGERNKSACEAELKRFRAEIEPALNKVLQLVPSNQEGAQQSREEAALCLSGIAADYTWANDFIAAEKLREEALSLAHGTLVAIRIEDGLERIRESALKQRADEVERFRALCRTIREELGSKIIRERGMVAERNNSICDAELKRFRTEIAPGLNKVLRLVPSNQEGAQQSREEAALCLSGIATDYTWADNYIVAEKLREEALSLADGTPVAIRIEDGLEQIREETRKQRAIGSSVDAFVQLCRSISAECWKKIQGHDRLQNLAILKAAFTDYQRQVSPWFAIICDSHPDNTAIIMKARNAAAESLTSLAGGFIHMHDFATAKRLGLRALPLVFDDDKLEAEIRRQLDYIASEEQKAQKSTPRPTARTDTQRPADGAGGNKKWSAPPPEKAVPGSRMWLKTIVVGIGGLSLLIVISFLFQAVNGPGWRPSASGSNPPPEGRSEYKQIAPAAQNSNVRPAAPSTTRLATTSQTSQASIAESAELTGTYSGVVQNLTAGVSADFTILVTERNRAIQGCMEVKPPLFGSGPLRGTTNGLNFSFVIASNSMQLEFDGQRNATNLSGTYLVSNHDGGSKQNGTFVLHKISAEGLSSGFTISNCRNDAPRASASAELSALKARIESGRSQMAVLKKQLQPATEEITSLNAQMETLEAELKSFDEQQKAGNQIDIDRYNAKVRAHNALLAKQRALIATNSSDLQTYNDLVTQDSVLVKQYNALVK
jgi:hypothetical protein